MGTRWNSLTEAVLTCTHDLCFRAKIRKISQFLYLKIIIFTAVKYHSILHRRVFVMICIPNRPQLIMLMQSTNEDQKQLETEFLIADWRQLVTHCNLKYCF